MCHCFVQRSTFALMCNCQSWQLTASLAWEHLTEHRQTESDPWGKIDEKLKAIDDSVQSAFWKSFCHQTKSKSISALSKYSLNSKISERFYSPPQGLHCSIQERFVSIFVGQARWLDASWKFHRILRSYQSDVVGIGFSIEAWMWNKLGYFE